MKPDLTKELDFCPGRSAGFMSQIWDHDTWVPVLRYKINGRLIKPTLSREAVERLIAAGPNQQDRVILGYPIKEEYTWGTFPKHCFRQAIPDGSASEEL